MPATSPSPANSSSIAPSSKRSTPAMPLKSRRSSAHLVADQRSVGPPMSPRRRDLLAGHRRTRPRTLVGPGTRALQSSVPPNGKPNSCRRCRRGSRPPPGRRRASRPRSRRPRRSSCWKSSSSASDACAASSTTVSAISSVSAITAQSPSMTQPPSSAPAQSLIAVETVLGRRGVLDLHDEDGGRASRPEVDGRHRGAVAQPRLDVVARSRGRRRSISPWILVEERLADVVVGVDADLVLERGELVQGPQRLDLLPAARVEVDRR